MPPRPPHALITGGSRGIGLSIARLLSSKNYRCTLLSRDETRLKAALESLSPPPEGAGWTHMCIPGSVAENAFWRRAARDVDDSGKVEGEGKGEGEGEVGGKAFEEYLPIPSSSRSPLMGSSSRREREGEADQESRSQIDVLINCAGISQSSLLIRTTPSALEDIVGTNLTSLMTCTRFLLKHKYINGRSWRAESKSHPAEAKQNRANQNKSPVIINVASLLGVKGGVGATAYAASKAGVLGFTRALAGEYASHGVRVNALVPGYVGTDMVAGLNGQELSKQIPLGRFGTTEEVAHAAFFLIENEYAHNCVLNLDGGLSAT